MKNILLLFHSSEYAYQSVALLGGLLLIAMSSLRAQSGLQPTRDNPGHPGH